MAKAISIEQFQRELENYSKQALADSKRFVTLSSAEVERTAKTLMRDTVTNPDVSYGKKGHHLLLKAMRLHQTKARFYKV